MSKIGTILKIPLVLLVFIIFGVSIYARSLVGLRTIITLGIIVLLYIVGVLLNRKKSNHTH